MALIVDPPETLGHGRLWSHVASDSSFDELHAFARTLGIPERGFDRDHYDVPAEWYDRIVAAGAVPVASRELIARLTAAGLRRPKASTLGPRRPGRPLLRPRRLHPGDLVAVVVPAGPVDEQRLEAGVAVLREWGLRVRVGGLRRSHPFLAGSDEERADELTAAMTDPGVRAVWTARGGYGTQRLLELLDWTLLARATPRLLIGFSDITALHQAVAARLGAVSVHAAGVAQLGDGDPATNEATRRLVTEGAPLELSGTPGSEPVRNGAVDGVLVGGNLTMLASSVGSRVVYPADGGIALLEDIGEEPYRIDRSLTQLLRSGWFDGVRGVACGGFTSCGDPDEVRAVLDERLGRLGVPVVHDLPVGHERTNLPVPLGIRAHLDASTGTLSVGRSLL
jgi:muramoyltetrapeptide carboxypeptidase